LNRLLPSVEITVLEQRDRPGGTMWTERRDGFQVEVGPNGFLDNKSSTVALCRDLGLADHLLAASEVAERNRYLFLDGRLRRLPTICTPFLSSDCRVCRGKLGIPREQSRPNRLEGPDEPLGAFVRRRAGSEAAAVLPDALAPATPAGDPLLFSARAASPRL